jgi:hypothetical protein
MWWYCFESNKDVQLKKKKKKKKTSQGHFRIDKGTQLSLS